jgi:hypothetical protein
MESNTNGVYKASDLILVKSVDVDKMNWYYIIILMVGIHSDML